MYNKRTQQKKITSNQGKYALKCEVKDKNEKTMSIFSLQDPKSLQLSREFVLELFGLQNEKENIVPLHSLSKRRTYTCLPGETKSFLPLNSKRSS